MRISWGEGSQSPLFQVPPGRLGPGHTNYSVSLSAQSVHAFPGRFPGHHQLLPLRVGHPVGKDGLSRPVIDVHRVSGQAAPALLELFKQVSGAELDDEQPQLFGLWEGDQQIYLSVLTPQGGGPALRRRGPPFQLPRPLRVSRLQQQLPVCEDLPTLIEVKPAPFDQLVPLPQPLDLGGCPRGPGEIRLFRCHQQAGDVIVLPEGLDLKLQGLDGPVQGGAGPLEHGHGALHPLLPVAGHHLSPDKEVGAPHREQGEGQQDEDGPPQQLLGAQPAYQRDAIHIPSLSFSTVFYHASRSQTSRTTSRVSTTKNMGRITFAPPFRASPAPT